ncbi:hypothetical protein VULLAG_LOCUS12935 [Vulpes lagopus]
MGQTAVGGALGISRASWYPGSSWICHHDAQWHLGVDSPNNCMPCPVCDKGRNWGNWWNPSCVQCCHSEVEFAPNKRREY